MIIGYFVRARKMIRFMGILIYLLSYCHLRRSRPTGVAKITPFFRIIIRFHFSYSFQITGHLDLSMLRNF
jgi:hypothetical protein